MLHVMEHWLEQWVHLMKDRSDDPSQLHLAPISAIESGLMQLVIIKSGILPFVIRLSNIILLFSHYITF